MHTVWFHLYKIPNALLQKADQWLPGDGVRHLWGGLEEKVTKGYKEILGHMFTNLFVELFSQVYTYVKIY